MQTRCSQLPCETYLNPIKAGSAHRAVQQSSEVADEAQVGHAEDGEQQVDPPQGRQRVPHVGHDEEDVDAHH